MKKEIFFLFSVLICLSFLSYVSADEYNNLSLNVSVSIREPVAEVEINPTAINLGSITRGYATDFRNITIINRGDLDVKVKPVLSSQNNIFLNLKFATASCSSWSNISSWTSSKIEKPDEYGGETDYHFCIKLDLEDYDEEIESDMDLTEEVTFWVMPA